MKNKKHGGTLFALLARHYLAFTLALLAIAFGLYELWSWRLGTYFSGADVTGMFSADALLDERYASLRAPRYLGTGGAFALYRHEHDHDHEADEGHGHDPSAPHCAHPHSHEHDHA